MPDQKVGAVLVVGGGIAGMQASLDLAESGFKVYLVEKDPSIGGVMAQLDKTFPTNDCAMCTLAPRMVDCGRHINIEKLTYAEVIDIEGTPGRFRVRIRKKARSVDPDKCTGCGECAQNCVVQYWSYPKPEQKETGLTAEERIKVDEMINRRRTQAGPLISVLQDVQNEYSYLPEPVLRHVSQELDIPLAAILKVATFYSYFSLKPKGKHVINICEGTSCYVRGSDRILEELVRTLEIKSGEVTPDGQFGLQTVRCLGCCALAPVIQVDKQVYAHMRPELVKEVLAKYGSGEDEDLQFGRPQSA